MAKESAGTRRFIGISLKLGSRKVHHVCAVGGGQILHALRVHVRGAGRVELFVEGDPRSPAKWRDEAAGAILWTKTSDAGRHAIAEVTFERIDVPGVTNYTFTLTAHAEGRGWDAAFGAGVVAGQISQFGRGERDSPATNDLPITMRLAVPPAPFELVRSA